ncbi:MAG: sulfatase-like hydrolase/transferase [Kiritimatiellales bacterium]
MRCELLLASTVAFTGAGIAERPNIIWIITDQQPADLMSCTGNSGLKTPAMDSLAASGVRFELAYCANPICVPSRTSMMTGRMPHETGVTFNMDRFDIFVPSLGGFITRAGYDTAYIGKWHIPMPAENQQWHGFNLMLEGTKKFNDQHFAAPAIDFIKTKRNKPFFLVASFTNPHDICEWARGAAGGFPEARTRLWNGKIPPAPAPENCPPLPENFEIPAYEPDIIREYQTWQKGTYPARGWPDERWRQYRWALNRLTERVDMEIGKILDALRDAGLDKNTVIIFTSDHGDGNSAHQWNQKTLHYDECARIPFIISGAGIANPGGVNCAHLISTGIDIFPTVCDYAGAEMPPDLPGRSVRPLVENRAGDWRDCVIIENDLSPEYGRSAGIEGRSLRTLKYKYTVYSTGKIREQLTDMKNDPGEIHNLAVDPAAGEILQQCREQLAAEFKSTGDTFVIPGISYDGWILK